MLLPLILLFGMVTEVHCACVSHLPCFAPSVDVAKLPHHTLTVNSTCGQPPEDFCIHEEVHEDCSLNCDAFNNQTWHPPHYMIDAFEAVTYWKSTNFHEPVFLQFDFKKKLLLHQVTLTFQFDLPNALYIQRSQDFGKTFTSLAYFAMQCKEMFAMAESSSYNQMDLLCFTMNPNSHRKQVSYAPRRDEFVASEVLKGGVVRDFYLISNVRIVLHEFYKPSDFNTAVADRRKYYFAIRDVDVQASCYCNGMSNLCSPKDYGTCLCQKNTEGPNCGKCMKLFNNKPWKFGVACEACNCNNHASECIYDPVKRSGVCIDCREHTRGDNCEICGIGYHRNKTSAMSDTTLCVSCNCFVGGVLRGSIKCHPESGDCYCKRNVQGRLCNKCKDEYYGLSILVSTGCLPCGCSHTGSLHLRCNKRTGVCPCRLGFAGRTCSQCVRGYFGYPVYNPNECRECDCNPSGALSMTCDKTGKCVCRDHYYGVKCEQIKPGFYSASVNQLVFTSNNAEISSPRSPFRHSLNVTDSSGNTYFVLGYAVGLGGSLASAITQLKFKVDVPFTTFYDLIIQYVTSFDFDDVIMNVELTSAFRTYTCSNGTVKVPSFTSRSLTSNIRLRDDFRLFGSLCLMEGRYEVSLIFSPRSSGGMSREATIFIISLLLVPKYQQSSRYISATAQKRSKVQYYNNIAPSYRQWAENELRGSPYMAYVYGSYYDNAFHCICDQTGSINPMVCNIYGGQCNCKKNIYGRACDNCLPQYYNFTSGLGCDPCNCNELGAYKKDCNAYTGYCSCKPNVIGRTCDKCKFQYYGIQGGQGCTACNCVSLYSLSSQCDDKGMCRCKPGVGGAKCDRCAPGYYRLSVNGCLKCTCDPVGTEGNQCDPYSGGCTCKERTTGAICDQCKYGYYGFSGDYPESCLPCHCNGITKECDPADDYYLMNVSTTFSTDVNNNAVQGWTSVDFNGYPIGETSWDWAPVYAINRGYAKLLDNGGTNPEHLFFSAPPLFLGAKKSSYMYYLTFDMTQEYSYKPMDEVAKQVGDVIMQGVGLEYKLVTSLSPPPPFQQNFKRYRVQFHERLWFVNDMTGNNPTSYQMRETLSNIQYIWIRGKWTKDKRKWCGLANVHMDYSSYKVKSKSGLRLVKNVEYCTCPPEYKGQFCQTCNHGYTKTPTVYGTDACTPCQCYGHSKKCHPTTGTCMDCKHKTEGKKCEKCVTGYYGKATAGTKGDCKPCACPGGLFAKNQFARKCVLNDEGSDEPYRCLQCDKGYSGTRCHVCSDGYYGNPMEAKGRCEKCTCNGNVDPDASSNCDTTTGECLRCLHDTVGHSCEFCRPGYYGNALTQSCRSCSCSKIGSFDNDCQNITGQCNCKPNVVGRTCDKCAPDTFNFKSNKGCELCKCNPLGSKSLQCNHKTGKCECKPSVTGLKCDTCAAGFYNLTEGCLPCNCSTVYSMQNATCHPVSGQCACIKSRLGGVYSGRTCNECDVNAIGTPPDCELCHSPCYGNWQQYIAEEEKDIYTTQEESTELLQLFGGMKYREVKENLYWLQRNITYINYVFTTSTHNTSTTEQKFQQIDSHVKEFETALKQTQQHISNSLHFFQNTVAQFNGTIPLSFLVNSPPSVFDFSRIKPTLRTTTKTKPHRHYINANVVANMAKKFHQTTRQNNMSAESMFNAITREFEEIIVANNSVFSAAQALSKSITQLSEAASERSRVTWYFDEDYETKFRASALELKKIHDVVVRVVLLQNGTVAVYRNAMNILNAIKQVILLSEQQAKEQSIEALTVVQTLSRMKVNSLTLNQEVSLQMGICRAMKKKVNKQLVNIEKEVEALAQGIRDLSAAKDKTNEAISFAREINKARVPVSITEIQTLSNQIISTIINEGLINATYTDAQHGLTRAKEVKERSQQALYVSQSTLSNIQNIETSVNKSAMLRAHSAATFFKTDQKLDSLRNITSVIENHFNAVSGEGGLTLNLLKKSLSDINSNEMCFLNTKFLIENATVVSEFARTKAQEALLMHQDNEKSLPQISDKINEVHENVAGITRDTMAAAATSEKLLSDVSEAEILLERFKEQEEELTEIEAENAELEAELAELMKLYEAEKERVSECNRV